MKEWAAAGLLLLVMFAGCTDDLYDEIMNYTHELDFNELPSCGNLICEQGETKESCPIDCREMENCEMVCNETAEGRSCRMVCWSNQSGGEFPDGFDWGNMTNIVCGDGICSPGETEEWCPIDCGSAIEFPEKIPECMNNICEQGEDSTNCCNDCGCSDTKACVNNKCISCGDGVCDSSKGENRISCCNDCGCDKFICNKNKCLAENEFYSTIGRRDFLRINNKIDVESIRNQVVSLVSTPPEGILANNPVWKMIAISNWIYENVNYVSDPAGTDYIAGPDETLRVGAGDCDDFAVLTTSMLESVGLDAAYALVDTDGDGKTDHAVTFVYYSGTAQEFLVDQAKILQKENMLPMWEIHAHHVSVLRQFTKTYNNGIWILIEPSPAGVGLPSDYELVYIINVGYVPPPI